MGPSAPPTQTLLQVPDLAVVLVDEELDEAVAILVLTDHGAELLNEVGLNTTNKIDDHEYSLKVTRPERNCSVINKKE